MSKDCFHVANDPKNVVSVGEVAFNSILSYLFQILREKWLSTSYKFQIGRKKKRRRRPLSLPHYGTKNTYSVLYLDWPGWQRFQKAGRIRVINWKTRKKFSV